MKELQKIQQDKIEVSEVKPIKSELRLLGSLRPERGHTCFEINTETGEVSVAEFEKINFNYSEALNAGLEAINEGSFVKKKLLTKQNCVYVTALNKKNALKKFKRNLLAALKR